jgi:hypothetical protein
MKNAKGKQPPEQQDDKNFGASLHFLAERRGRSPDPGSAATVAE